MDASHFDAWTRTLSTRRTALAGVVGGGVATLLSLTMAGGDAAAKDCPRGEKKCGKRCIPNSRECCNRGQKQCGKKCIAKSKCCKNADCGPRRLCANGQCIIGQGTCPADADACTDGEPQCNQGSSPCYCVQTTTGQTRCADFSRIGECGGCLSNADCARDFPRIPGMFCAQLSDGCLCADSTVCLGPCAA